MIKPLLEHVNLLIVIMDAIITIYIVKLCMKHLRKPDGEKAFRKWYHCCKYCKHCNIRGIDKRGTSQPYAAFCFHPDSVASFQALDRVDLDFYCGKWETSDSFNTELFKAHSEKCLESPKRDLKNSRQ